MKISIEEEERAKHKKDNTLKPWCPRPARKTYSCDEQCSPSYAKGHPLANSSHVRKRGYRALTRDGWHVGEKSNAELRRLITTTQFKSTAYIWISANSVIMIPQLSIHRFRPIIYNSFIRTAGKKIA